MRRQNLLLSLVFAVSAGAGSVSGCGSDDDGPNGRIIDGDGGPEDDGGRFPPEDDTGSPSGSSVVGKACLEDLECPSGLVCLTDDSTDFLGGGPSNGLCTARCLADTECAQLDPSSFCLGVSDNGTPRIADDDIAFCVQGCTIGVDPEKCQGRPDVACFETGPQPGDGVCIPICSSDEQCPADRVCHTQLGVCVPPEEVTGTLPIGAECDPDAPDCQGGCIQIAQGYFVCTAFCTLGDVGCGATSSGDPLDAFCVYGDSAGADVGDLGYCGQLCDCNGDCGHPDAICEEIGGTFEANTGRVGLCVPQQTTSDAGVLDPGIACAATPPDSGTSTPDSGAPEASAADSG